jgi:hypothetical protein
MSSHDHSPDLDIETLRVSVYRDFSELGRSGQPSELAESLGASESSIREGLRQLAIERHVVLDESGAVVMAHPFAAVPLGFPVMGARPLWWGGCAWDSFALPHVLPHDHEVLVATRCPNCDRAHAWSVSKESAPVGDQVAHFLTPAARIWDDVVDTCANQRIFCREECVDSWLANTGNSRGYVTDLATLWRLASKWYEGRLEYGYVRRDPSSAAAYFYEVGLRGPFWGLASE